MLTASPAKVFNPGLNTTRQRVPPRPSCADTKAPAPGVRQVAVRFDADMVPLGQDDGAEPASVQCT
ncbi:hypothetical protein ACEN8K_32285, partial [Variovorax sp. CT11-76]